MNFLAHLHLSYPNPHLMCGNYLADFLRNKEVELLTDSIKSGITMHRWIDSYTDSHPVNDKALRWLRKNHGKYSPVVLDVLYDYFLIKNWSTFSDQPLEDFAEHCYSLLEQNIQHVDGKALKKLENIIEHRWLIRAFKTTEGLNNTFGRLDKRAKYHSGFSLATKTLSAHEDILNTYFLEFYPILYKGARKINGLSIV